ncbi:MAG TPA: hypothetical protein VEW68_08280, partial [Patescibacteria group bacterium]|nr:hypothetical protein [Patescibacteria group bacterium]
RLESLRSPALTGALVAAGILLFTGAAFTRRRRRRRRQRRAGESAQRPPRPMPQRLAEPVAGVLAIGLLALLPFLALAALAFTRPATALLPYTIPYRQGATLSYSANAAPGPVYPENRAVTGDPLFTHVVHTVGLRLGYAFHSAAPHSLDGEASLSATIASTSGWQTTLELARPTRFRGDRAVLTADLDLTSLLALLHRVETTTAMSGTYTLTLVPHVSTTGSLGALPLQATFSQPIRFSINRLEVQPLLPTGGSVAGGSAGGERSSANPLAPSRAGSATGRRYQPLFLSFKLARLSGATARRIALAAIVIIACVLLATLVLLRPRGRDEAAAIRARYGRLIVPVARVWQLPGVPVIDVSDMEALVRIAEHYDRSILLETAEEGEAFWVADESGQFRYAVGEPAYAVAEEAAHYEPYYPPAGEVYAEELELGEAVVAFKAQPASETFAADPAAEEPWPTHDPADTFVREGDAWRAACEAAEVVYADELELGEAVSAFETRPAPQTAAGARAAQRPRRGWDVVTQD